MKDLFWIMALLQFPMTASAWHQNGHNRITSLAVAITGGIVPKSFTELASFVSHCSADPDVMREKSIPQLSDSEKPEHYIDLELLQRAELPPLRFEFYSLCQKKGLDPRGVGMVPYSIIEGTQRLTIAFAEMRKWPQKREIALKAALYAGLLSHYAADLCMPLHVTMFYDGRDPQGKPARTGIHNKIDALIEKYPLISPDTAGLVCPPAFGDVWTGTLGELGRSANLVDTALSFETIAPDPNKPWPNAPRLTDFTRQRLRTAVLFVATLFRSSWEASRDVSLPEWDVRSMER